MSTGRQRPVVTLRAIAVAIAILIARPAQASESVPNGQQIFAARCARCHGPHGEGTDDHEARLEGELSVAQLAEVIAETMPEDDPGTLSADEASAVAAYIHAAFYSPVAAARNAPARIALARLTVRQYRHAVADLIAGFSDPPRLRDGRGLRGAYFNNREPKNRRDRVARRIDDKVDFDFGTTAPFPEIDDPRRWSVRWTGALIAPETGDYEFIVRTEHAARLWLNDDESPLIDAWVKSGDDTEYKSSLFLVGGRVYPLRLEFSKAKLGVDDAKKQKKKEQPPSPPASIRLLWQPPRGVAETLPARFLAPDRVPPSFVSSVPIPPDDRSCGWERGTAVSQAWDEATTNAAIQATAYVIQHLNQLAGTRPEAPNHAQRLRDFCRQFAERAFRHPLDDELRDRYVDRQFDEADDPELAVRRVVLLVLKSPRFLFREIATGADQYDVASRLSFGLWDSLPDNELLAAARAGRLTTDDEIRAQAERMLADLRARAKLRGFLFTWLNVDGDADLAKDPEQFPGFDAEAVADLRTSLELFLDDVVWSDSSDFRLLLLCDDVYLNDRLARLYAAPNVPAPSEFTPTRLDGNGRAGVLTHPYIMARFSHRRQTSPIHRGVFLARGVLGLSLRPPPEAFTPLAPELHPDLTTRQRVALQTKDAACMSCHRIINPLGFALEEFDAIGRHRDSENGKPINASARYRAPDGTTTTLRGARDLAEYLAASDDCHAAFVEQLFHHLVQQPVLAYGPTTLDDLRRTFAADNFHIRRLAVEIMVASARTGRETMDADDTPK